MKAEYLLAVVAIVVGLWFLYRGYKLKSNPRMLAGVAVAVVGIAQFFQARSSIGTALLAIGFMMLVTSLYAMKMEHGRIVRPTVRRRRR